MENKPLEPQKPFTLSKKGTKAFQLVIIVLLGLGAVAAVILWGLRGRIEEDANIAALPPVESPLTKGSQLTLKADRQTYKVGETFDVTMELLSREVQVVGMDAQITYDPAAVSMEPMDAKAKDQTAKFVSDKDSVFDTYLGFSNDSKKGFLMLSAIKEPGTGYAKNGNVAVFRFKALKAGKTNIAFKFTKDSTVDTNVARTAGNGSDALDRVKNLEITIE